MVRLVAVLSVGTLVSVTRYAKSAIGVDAGATNAAESCAVLRSKR